MASPQRPRSTQDITPARPAARPASIRLVISKKTYLGLLGAAVVIAALAIIWVNFSTNSQQKIMTDRQQAVFLNNGKVFFGKLQNTTGEYLTLKDAYYTQAAEEPSATNGTTTVQPVSSNVSLVAVGEEVYGPENSLSIRSDQVSFWQNLKADSKVTEAINAKK